MIVVLATEAAAVKLPETKPVGNVESIERQLYHLKSCTHIIIDSTEDNIEDSESTEMIDLITDVSLLTLSDLLYILKFVSDLRQVGGFLRVLWLPQPIKWTPTI